jgi:hypothetical protein
MRTVPLKRASDEAEAHTQPRGTVSLVLGSGLHTSPMPDFAMLSSRVVVVNLGPTACDGEKRVIKVECSTDTFMEKLCAALGVTVPPFVFRQSFRVGWRSTEQDEEIEVFVAAARINESVTFADVCEISSSGGGGVQQVDADLSWQFKTRVRRAERATVTLRAKAEYVGAAPITVELDTSAAPSEQVLEFVHSL